MITGESNGSGAGMQIMGAVAEDVEIMGFGTITSQSLQGFGADPTLIPAQKAPWEQTGTQTVQNAMMAENQQGKNLATSEKIGVAAVLLLLAGGVAYAMHKK